MCQKYVLYIISLIKSFNSRLGFELFLDSSAHAFLYCVVNGERGPSSSLGSSSVRRPFSLQCTAKNFKTKILKRNLQKELKILFF